MIVDLRDRLQTSSGHHDFVLIAIVNINDLALWYGHSQKQRLLTNSAIPVERCKNNCSCSIQRPRHSAHVTTVTSATDGERLRQRIIRGAIHTAHNVKAQPRACSKSRTQPIGVSVNVITDSPHLPKDAPSKTLLNRLKDVEAREEQLEATITRLQKEIDLKRAERQTISDPHELRLAIRQSENIEMRFRLREEIRRRVSGIEIRFRGPVIITNITFVTGAARQIVFLDREGDYKTIDAEEAVKMMSTAVDTVYVKKLIHVPERYEDENYRREVYERWMAEWAAAQAQLNDVNNSPHYGEGWRVD